jgi:hypothetical protein
LRNISDLHDDSLSILGRFKDADQMNDALSTITPNSSVALSGTPTAPVAFGES